MKGIICYFSSTGNTELACRYIAGNLEGVDFDLFDIRSSDVPDMSSYDIAGFAAFTDWWDIPLAFERFMGSLPLCPGKHAFVFNTYAHLSGKTLRTLADMTSGKCFRLIGGYSLRMPVNYPPSLLKGRDFGEAPDEKDMKEFNSFIKGLNGQIARLKGGRDTVKPRIRIGLFNSISKRYHRTKAREDMGELFVDSGLCTGCGLCRRQCAGRAIELNPLPVFDNSRCAGCWACFNNCPNKAIYTKDIKGSGHYQGPDDKLKEKLS